VAVPERSIGSSFAKTDLKQFGFFANWEPNDNYNLCTPGNDGSSSKVQAFHNFLNNPQEQILICTHATLRFACEGLEETAFNDCLLAIDEFHHVSADVNNRLGDLIRNIMQKSTAHLIAMTGSYFRGDSVPVLHPDDEAKFTKVTYNYYQQLNGYDYLKSLGIGYHFYQGKYTDSIMEVLDLNKKTILHIPNVNSGESTKDKHQEVDTILDSIGDIIKVDSETGIIHIKRKTDGKLVYGKKKGISNFRKRDNIWFFGVGNNKSTKDKIAFQHPAIFPELLANDHIISWSNEEDLVYDPFMGSGTTGIAALKHGCIFTGIDIDKNNIKIAKGRTK
jgi:hypothetical protein